MGKRCVAILGDSVGLAHGVPEGEGFVHRVSEALRHHGVLVLNWSREEATATGWATEQLEDLQAQIEETVAECPELLVVIELGIHDRVFLADMLEQALGMLVRVVQSANAQPVVMQIVPDDIDRLVAEAFGVPLVHTPDSVRQQFEAEPTHPFVPHPACHEDLASALLRVLEPELGLMGAAGSDEAHVRGHASGREGRFDGIWMHKDMPEILEVIQGDTIMSVDGHKTRIYPIGPDSFYIEHGNQRIEAQVRGPNLNWSDGDLWCLVEDEGVPALSLPQQRTVGGDLKSLLLAFEKAEEAVARTHAELERAEIQVERERLEEERAVILGERRRLEEGMKALHEETSGVSALRAARPSSRA